MKTVYKLTSTTLTTHGGYQWIVGEWRETPGTGDLCSAGWLHWYADPLLAVLLDPIHGNLGPTARLWEAEADGECRDDCGIKGGSIRLRLVRELPLPVVTTEQRVKFGILCAQAVVGNHCPAWSAWADRWLSGEDRSAEAAWAAWTWAAAAGDAAWAAWAWAGRTVTAWAAAAETAARVAAAWSARAAARAARAEWAIPLDLLARRAVEP